MSVAVASNIAGHDSEERRKIDRRSCHLRSGLVDDVLEAKFDPDLDHLEAKVVAETVSDVVSPEHGDIKQRKFRCEGWK